MLPKLLTVFSYALSVTHFISNSSYFWHNAINKYPTFQYAQESGARMKTFEFTNLPASVEELTALPEYGFDSPFRVAALLVASLTAWSKNRDACYEMIDLLKGPQKMSPMDKSFIRDRMMGKGDYIGLAYFAGATPENNYQPAVPYRIEILENAYSYDNEGYARLLIKTAGADSPRQITLRRKGSEWFVWEFPGLLADIRKPVQEDPWA